MESYLALACDYDGALASEGQVDAAILAALRRFRETGRRLILVTGRRLEGLLPVFPHINLFERAVLENGALLYRPAKGEERLLGAPPSEVFVRTLKARGVNPLSVGRVITATWEPHVRIVHETIRELGLELEVILNKRAVMVLPPGINKASGLRIALDELGLPPEKVVGVGDAENDRDLLDLCGYGVAVANALPMLKDCADFVTVGERGAGVCELIDKLMS
ncbi:MAG: Cof-type HAD-IIB family hydrolase [Pseudanabaenales cyanobacterium]|nr:Cof-type HAD-IIB family hydrolase [Pseudanabaenales cyanobacterium]